MSLLNNQALLNKLMIISNLMFGVLFIALFYTVIHNNNKIEGILKQHAIDIMSMRWEEFKNNFRKNYKNEDITHSFANPVEDNSIINLCIRNKINWDFHESKFAKIINASIFISRKNNSDLPDNIDWRKMGAVTKVRDQRSCGSCWVFVAAAAMEAQYFQKTGELISLSVQNLLDCSNGNTSLGDLGDYPYNVFNYITLHGITTESDYPYLNDNDTCRNISSIFHIKSNGFVRIERGNEQHLKEAVATVGPVVVAINGYAPSFVKYTGGVFSGSSCENGVVDHAMLVVGYGTDPENGDYWLLKNTWGTNWGEDGYMRLARNKNNTCNVASVPLYPIL